MYLETEKPTRKGLRFTHYERLGKHPLKSTIVKLYDTNVLICDGNQIKLNSGGFKTNHTKNVMNDFLPEGYNVQQIKYEWYVNTPTGTINFTDDMILKIEGA